MAEKSSVRKERCSHCLNGCATCIYSCISIVRRNNVEPTKQFASKPDDGTDPKSTSRKCGEITAHVNEEAKLGIKDHAGKLTVIDPFLAKFGVRTYSDDEEGYTIWDLLTKKFWSTVVVDSTGTSYFYWSMVMMFAVLYNVMIVIVRAIFSQPHASNLIPMWFFLDYMCDFLYCWDMFVRSRIGFLEQGILVKDVPRLRDRYIKQWNFYLDVVSLLPFDILYIIVGYNACLRFNRLLKFWRLVEFFHIAETHTNFPNLIRVTNLVLYIVIIIHWNGCFYYGISYLVGFGSDSWSIPALDGEFSSFWMQYLYSFYWSTVTMTTIGDTNPPVTVWETLYVSICFLLGVLIFATIFGNVGAMINSMDAARTEFQNKVDSVKRYMEIRGIANDLQERVIKWFEYTWNNKQSIDDKEALIFLPEKLRAEISIHVHMQTLRRVAVFQDCEPGLLVELVLKLKLQVFSPGDFICRKGDIGKEMYIIKQGKLQVVSEDGKKVFVTLSDGAVFGEISVLNIAGNKTGNRRTASVKTVGFSDLFCLTKNDLWEALEEYPEAKKMLMEKGKQLLRKDKLLDEEAAVKEERRREGMITKIEMVVDAVEVIQSNLIKLHERIDKMMLSTMSNTLTTPTPLFNMEQSTTLIPILQVSQTLFPTVEQPKTPLPTVDNPKILLPTVEQPKTPLPTVDHPKTLLPTVEQPKTPLPTVEQPKTLLSTVEQPKTPLPTVEQPKTLLSTVEQPKTPLPTVKQPKTPTLEQPKTPLPTTEQPKTPLPNVEQPKTPLPIVEQPKTPLPTAEQPKSSLTRVAFRPEQKDKKKIDKCV